jgi:glycosyltransferase involved in cell wall biosynthesis
MSDPRPARVALFMHNLKGGGAERVVLDLAVLFQSAGVQVEVVVGSRKGGLAEDLPDGLVVTELGSQPWRGRLQAFAADRSGFFQLARPVLLPWRTSKTIGYLPGLVDYLRREQPDALLSVLSFGNLVAIWARELAGVSTRIVVSERNTLSLSRIATPSRRRRWRRRYLPGVIERTYPQADAITAVSDGVADDLAEATGLARDKIVTVYNPVVTERLQAGASEALDHPWFQPGETPVILSAGRLHPQKDFEALLRAFAEVRAKRKLRLVILGEGPRSSRLKKLAAELGIADDFDLPGFARNPFAYMARAKLFVLSSRFEGLPGVLIQALACGCNAVSTDCPSGPREILDGGRYGALVPVGDVSALAAAMEGALESPIPAEQLRERAQFFSAERAVARYLELLLPDRVAS